MLPTLVLVGVFGIGPFISLEPEAIPIKIPLKVREPRLRMIWLMLLVGIVVQFDGPLQTV
jgi:hypothetical protein